MTWFRDSGQQFILLSPIHAPKNLTEIFDETFKSITWDSTTNPNLTLISAPIQLHEKAIHTLVNTEICWSLNTANGVNHASK